MENFLHILLKPDNLPVAGMIPLFLLALIWAMVQSRRERERSAGASAGEGTRTPIRAAAEEDKVHTWPYLARVEFLAAALVLIALVIWSIMIDAPLEAPANPMVTPNPAKAPWYFLGLQELLVYFDPWIAGVVIPTLIVIGLALIPYLDANEKGTGGYFLHSRPFAAAAFLFGFLVLGLGLISLGVFCRGPGWNFFWPWEYWDQNKVSAMTNVNLPEALGIKSPAGKFTFGALFEFGYYSLGALSYLIWRKRPAVQKLGLIRYGMVSFLFLAMLAVPLKMVLRIFFNVKYVWVTPWFSY